MYGPVANLGGYNTTSIRRIAPWDHLPTELVPADGAETLFSGSLRSNVPAKPFLH